MFDEVLDVVIVAVVALLGLAAGFALGKMRGQASARMAKASEVDALRGSCEAMKDDNARLAAQVAQAKAQSEGLLQQLSFAKSQLAQAQQAEQVRVQRERERAEAQQQGPRRLGRGATAQHCGVRRFAGARRLRYAGGDDWRRR